jgi:hypothetical protein
MDRRLPTAIVLGFIALAVVAAGAWLSFSDAPGDRGSEADVEPDAAGRADAGPRNLDVPRCTVRLRVAPTFRREETEHKSPNLRVYSSERATQVEVACRRADRGFDRAQFLRETLDSVAARFDGELDGKREISSGPADGWTTWRATKGQVRFFNVLVRDTSIVIVRVYGPDNPATREFNDRLLADGLIWPGEAASSGEDDVGPDGG